jgi:cell division protein FtsQ
VTLKARRRKKSAIARIRPFWMPVTFSSAVVIGALAVLIAWPGFDPKQIVVTGNLHVTRGEILSRAAIARNVSIWFQSTGAIARRIEAIPYIRTAAVHRVPPASLRIVVDERVPFAVLQSGAEAAVIDRTLRVLTPVGEADDERPVLVAKAGLDLTPGSFVATRGVVELRNAYDAVTAAQIVPLEISLDRFGGIVVELRSGLRLLLGSESQLDRKLTLASAIIAQVVSHERRVDAIDLRAPSAPVLVYR